jgi:hypothetical protein
VFLFTALISPVFYIVVGGIVLFSFRNQDTMNAAMYALAAVPVWGIADKVRQFAQPDVIVSGGGFEGALKARAFWSWGPQVIAVLVLTIFFWKDSPKNAAPAAKSAVEASVPASEVAPAVKEEVAPAKIAPLAEKAENDKPATVIPHEEEPAASEPVQDVVKAKESD